MNQHRETLAVHGGQAPDPASQARGVPVHRTTAISSATRPMRPDCSVWKSLGICTPVWATPPRPYWKSA